MPIKDRNLILDEEEIKTYYDYMQIPFIISKNSSLDYSSHIYNNPKDTY